MTKKNRRKKTHVNGLDRILLRDAAKKKMEHIAVKRANIVIPVQIQKKRFFFLMKNSNVTRRLRTKKNFTASFRKLYSLVHLHVICAPIKFDGVVRLNGSFVEVNNIYVLLEQVHVLKIQLAVKVVIYESFRSCMVSSIILLVLFSVGSRNVFHAMFKKYGEFDVG